MGIVEFRYNNLGVKNWLGRVINGEFTITKYMTINVTGSVKLTQPIKVVQNLLGSKIKFGRVSGHFDCSNLIESDMVGLPHEIGGNFDCSNSGIISLSGSPINIGGDFNCSGNRLPRNISDGPVCIGGDLICVDNEIGIVDNPITCKIGGKFLSSIGLFDIESDISLNTKASDHQYPPTYTNSAFDVLRILPIITKLLVTLYI